MAAELTERLGSRLHYIRLGASAEALVLGPDDAANRLRLLAGNARD